MPHDLPKAYEPGAIEPRWADYWVNEKLFHVETPAASGGGQPISRETFTITLPPPNVTGNLHMGHMLEHTEIDIIVRWKRMSGLPTLWLPGTDHAGIATQLMVERQLASEGKNRRDIGREAFVARVWDWKKHYGGVILQQMKRLGASVDWSREYFTMDERMSRAVREAFVRLHEEGLIYRGKYIVNWCRAASRPSPTWKSSTKTRRASCTRFAIRFRISPTNTSSLRPRVRRPCWGIPRSP